MRRISGPGLPCVRVSFAGGKGGRARPWAALLLLLGMVMVIGYGHVAGRLQFRHLLDASLCSSSTGSSSSHLGASAGMSAPGLLGGAVLTTAAAAAGGAGGGVERLQALQQGIDIADSSAGPGMLGGGASSSSSSTSSSSSSSSSSTMPAGLLEVLARVRSNISAAVNRRPLVHGRVRKAGMLDPRAWLANHTDERLDSFTSWRVNRTRLGGNSSSPAGADAYTCAGADHPPLPFPGCHVFVNHQYKYIYIRNPKSASTSIVNVLGECDNQRTQGANSSSCMALHFYWPKGALQMERLRATWSDYFVFGFVRNPWRRAYSLYKYLHSSGCMNDTSLKDPRCRVPWSQFCSDPWRTAEELHDHGCIARSKSYLYFHMTDQYHCLHTHDGQWAVDFVGRVDEPNEDWAEVMRTLNAQRLPGAPELPVAPLEQRNAHSGHSDPYNPVVAGQAQCFDAVSRWYACDVQRFGFDAAGASSSSGGVGGSGSGIGIGIGIGSRSASGVDAAAVAAVASGPAAAAGVTTPGDAQPPVSRL